MLTACLSTADAVDIPEYARVNKNPGSYCTWTCIDVLSRRHNITPLRGLLRERWLKRNRVPDPGYPTTVLTVLKERDARYDYIPQWSYNRKLLNDHADTLGVIVSLKDGNPYSNGCHSVIVTFYDQHLAQFYDPNRPDKIRLTCSREWFDTWWLGDSLVLYPSEPTGSDKGVNTHD